MTTLTNVATPSECWTDEYWLTQCRGFRVSAPGGHVGYVEEVLLAAEGTSPAAIVVRGERAILVPAQEIIDVLPGEERVVLRSRPQ